MRCDLHVHSRVRGRSTCGLRAGGRRVVRRAAGGLREARRRGMDLFTLTDHDTIAGALELAHRPGTFVSEEVSCALPGGRVLHVGVFGIDEAQHEAIARRRHDAEALFAYLAEERIPAGVNHPFSALTGRARDGGPAARASRACPGGGAQRHDVGGGQRARGARRPGGRACRGRRQRRAHARLGGARLHRRAGRRDREEFLAGLRRGLTMPAGPLGPLRAPDGGRRAHRRRARTAPARRAARRRRASALRARGRRAAAPAPASPRDRVRVRRTSSSSRAATSGAARGERAPAARRARAVRAGAPPTLAR